jgi:hypothetical protein
MSFKRKNTLLSKTALVWAGGVCGLLLVFGICMLYFYGDSQQAVSIKTLPSDHSVGASAGSGVRGQNAKQPIKTDGGGASDEKTKDIDVLVENMSMIQKIKGYIVKIDAEWAQQTQNDQWVIGPATLYAYKDIQQESHPPMAVVTIEGADLYVSDSAMKIKGHVQAVIHNHIIVQTADIYIENGKKLRSDAVTKIIFHDKMNVASQKGFAIDLTEEQIILNGKISMISVDDQ